MPNRPVYKLGYTPRSNEAEGTVMGTWRDRECKGCGETFSPTSKNQQYCPACTTQCRVPGCEMKVRAKGYCAAHLRQTHPVSNIPMRDSGLCGVDGCERQAFAKGHCQLHYDRVRFYAGAGDATPKKHKTSSSWETLSGLLRIHPSLVMAFTGTFFSQSRQD